MCQHASKIYLYTKAKLMSFWDLNLGPKLNISVPDSATWMLFNTYLHINSGMGLGVGAGADVSRANGFPPPTRVPECIIIRGPTERSEDLTHRLWPHKLRRKLFKGELNTPSNVIVTSPFWQQKRHRNTKRGDVWWWWKTLLPVHFPLL